VFRLILAVLAITTTTTTTAAAAAASNSRFISKNYRIRIS